jgi:hypothetical protein
MSDEEKADEPRAKRRLWVWAVVLPVVYVLSIGPFCGIAGLLLRHDPRGRAFGFLIRGIDTIYAPVFWLGDCMGLNGVLIRYLRLFLDI